MGIMDKVTSLLPWREERREPSSASPEGLALRDDLDRWLERLVQESRGAPGIAGWMPTADVHETDDELVVTLEVPGPDRENLDLVITPDALVVRGEKRETREDRRRDFHVAECRYGSFVRTVPLPSGIDRDRAEARLRNGVLTIRFPKAAGRPDARRIPIQR
jgi:HSP20 family protein